MGQISNLKSHVPLMILTMMLELTVASIAPIASATSWPAGVKPITDILYLEDYNKLYLTGFGSPEFDPGPGTVPGGSAYPNPSYWYTTSGSPGWARGGQRTYTWPSITFSGKFTDLEFWARSQPGSNFYDNGNHYALSYTPAKTPLGGGN
jgi:hypothetical protein